VVVDPPRPAGGKKLPRSGCMSVSRVTYVSCDPATLARDFAAVRNQVFGSSRRTLWICSRRPFTWNRSASGALTLDDSPEDHVRARHFLLSQTLEEVLQHVDAHRAYCQGLKLEKLLIASGPLVPRCGGAMLLRVPTTKLRRRWTVSATTIRTPGLGSRNTKYGLGPLLLARRT